jgi:hypothetical protein
MKLDVIFQGANAFYEDPDPAAPWINVFVIDLKDDHTYLCGKFLGETRIPRGSHMTLVGVTPGSATFSDSKGGFVYLTPANVHLDNVYSRFTFPRPNKIYHAFNMTLDPTAPPPPPGTAPKLCIVPVFEYDFDSFDKLRLRLFLNYAEACAPDDPTDPTSRSDTFNWAPNAADLPARADGSIPPYTLHVIAEEDYDDRVHAIRDFNAAAQTLKAKADLSIYTDVDTAPEIPPGMEGRADWEINLSLRQRVSWLSTKVGQVIQQNPPIRGSKGSLIVDAPSEPSDNDATCGPAIGGWVP